ARPARSSIHTSPRSPAYGRPRTGASARPTTCSVSSSTIIPICAGSSSRRASPVIRSANRSCRRVATRAGVSAMPIGPFGLDPVIWAPLRLVIAVGLALFLNITGAELNIGLLYLTTLGSMTVLGIVIAGWASNNKYALVGGLRSAGQLISYEIPQILALVTVALVVGSLSMRTITASQPGPLVNVLVLPFSFLVYFIAALAETNRTPFDLPEAESELVAGWLTEYSGMR